MRTTRKWTLFYDASCNLCHASQKRLKEWARAKGETMEVHTLQGPYAKEKGYAEHMVIEVDGKPYIAGEAWLRAMELAPWYLSWIASLRHFFVTKWIAIAFYNFVAHTRHWWFGRRKVGIACPPGGG